MRATWLKPLLLILVLAACSPLFPVPQGTPTPTPLPPTPTPLPPVSLWLGSAVPGGVRDVLDRLVTQNPDQFVWASGESEAQVTVSMSHFSAPPEGGVLLGTWAYAPVAPFPTYADGLSFADLQAFWDGDGSALIGITNDGSSPTMFIAQETVDALATVLGPVGPSAAVEIVPAEELLRLTWAARPSSLAIIPFEELEPRWKVLAVDGVSVLDRSIEDYALLFGIWLGGENQAMARVHSFLAPLTNRDEAKMTTLIMTGVTALVRGTAARMENNGVLYPGEDIAEILKSADLTHISNEIPFWPGCPFPDPNDQSLVFCSDPKYMELLQYVGADIIELTGNHMNDYGHDAFLYTLDLYDEVGLPYYAAGRNLEEATSPLIINYNGNSLAFLGCNPYGPEYVWATTNGPGAAPCDFAAIEGEVARLKEEGNLVIFTWQNYEVYDYSPPTCQDDSPIACQREYAAGIIEAGADIVSGSQSHHPQGFEFFPNGFVHYGLGNLFFDQMWALGTRQEFADRHVFYAGQHISTQLLTFMLEDYARPRPMTEAERRDLLESVFAASGW